MCITVTHVDALVLTKSQFHHSAKYRSLVILGTATPVLGDAERALAAIIDHNLPGRSGEARPPTRSELLRTAVLAVPIDEASVKIRAHGPVDDPDDLTLHVGQVSSPSASRPARHSPTTSRTRRRRFPRRCGRSAAIAVAGVPVRNSRACGLLR